MRAVPSLSGPHTAAAAAPALRISANSAAMVRIDILRSLRERPCLLSCAREVKGFAAARWRLRGVTKIVVFCFGVPRRPPGRRIWAGIDDGPNMRDAKSIVTGA